MDGYKASYSFTLMLLAVDGKIIVGSSGPEFGIRGFITTRDAESVGDTWPGDTSKYGGGGLYAIDTRNGELVWVHNSPMPFRSSVMATAGNLVFAGDTGGYNKAFNAITGAQLWSFYCGTAVMGGVNTFTMDGKQMLAVVAGQAETGLDQDWPKRHHKRGYLISLELH